MKKARDFVTRDGSSGIGGVAMQMSEMEIRNSKLEIRNKFGIQISNSEKGFQGSKSVAIGGAIWHRESKYVEVGCEY
jgi:hypothetical protein